MHFLVDPLSRLARQTFTFLSRSIRRGTDTRTAADQLVYRLKRWPQLPSHGMSTDIYRTLSVMSTRPVNRRWILGNSSMKLQEVDGLLRRLVEMDAVEVTDCAKYGPHTHPA